MTIDRFWSKVDASAGPNACWPWKCSLMSAGYGSYGFRGRTHPAHRVAYELHNGAIPAGLCICHACDNKLCCNPAHLWAGTNADNVRDKVMKGRAPRKLSDCDIVTARVLQLLGMTRTAVAAMFNVSRKAIYNRTGRPL